MPDTRLGARKLASPPKLFEVTEDSIISKAIIGYTHCLSEWSLQPHVHTCFELHIVLSGRFLYEVHDELHHLSMGDICITKPGQIHSMCVDCNNSSEIIHLQLDTIHSDQLGAVFYRTSARSLHACQELIPILQDAITELEQPGPFCQMLVSSLIYQFLIRIGKRIWHAAEPINTSPGYTQKQGIVDVLWYLESNCQHGITLDELAIIAGMSKSALSHQFTQEMNESICRHNQRLVMQKARMLVEEGNLRLSEIAELLGFPSPNYFSSAFKTHFGVSPSAFKAQRHSSDTDTHN